MARKSIRARAGIEAQEYEGDAIGQVLEEISVLANDVEAERYIEDLVKMLLRLGEDSDAA